MSLTATPYVVSALEHSAQLFRQAFNCLISGSGVVGSTDLEVKEHSAANLSVNVEPGYVFIPGTQGSTTGQRVNTSNQHGTYSALQERFTSQGVYLAVNAAVTNLAIAEGNSEHERIDLICAVVQDAQYGGSFNQALLTVVTGTPSGSPVAPTPPENSVVLAQIKVASKAKEIKKASITNERPTAGSAGAWVKLTLGAKIETAGLQTPSARIENGGASVRLKGAVKVKAGQTLTAGEGVFAPPPVYYPPAGSGGGAVNTPVWANATFTNLVIPDIEVGGFAVLQLTNVPEGGVIDLDCLTYNII